MLLHKKAENLDLTIKKKGKRATRRRTHTVLNAIIFRFRRGHKSVTHKHTYIRARSLSRTHTHTYTHTHTHTHTHTYTQTYTRPQRINISLQKKVEQCNAQAHMHTRSHARARAHTHRHIHTHTFSLSLNASTYFASGKVRKMQRTSCTHTYVLAHSRALVRAHTQTLTHTHRHTRRHVHINTHPRSRNASLHERTEILTSHLKKKHVTYTDMYTCTHEPAHMPSTH